MMSDDESEAKADGRGRLEMRPLTPAPCTLFIQNSNNI